METYATLRVFSKNNAPGRNWPRPGRRGHADQARSDSESKYRNRRENHFWAWSSDSVVQSLDGMEHVRVISLLQDKEHELARLREAGCDIDVCCYWVSSGQGGPFLDNQALTSLARLGLEIWWDVYFGKEQDYEESPVTGAADTA